MPTGRYTYGHDSRRFTSRRRVRQHHFGEDEYEQSETVVQRLLAAAGGVGVRNSEAVTVEAAGVEAPADWANLH